MPGAAALRGVASRCMTWQEPSEAVPGIIGDLEAAGLTLAESVFAILDR